MRKTGSFRRIACRWFAVAVAAAVVSVTAVDAVGQATDPAGPAMARLEVRLADLERELRGTTGRIEEMNFRLRQLEERLDKLVADIDYRLTRLGAAPGGAAAASPPFSGSGAAAMPSAQPTQPGSAGAGAPTVLGRVPKTDPDPGGAEPQPSTPASPSAPGSVLPAGTPREQYAYGFGLMRKANYDEAEVAFQAFLRAHPDDPLAGNARYWLGETYYVRGDYARAAETFLEGYQRDKTGSKAPDTLLKLGMSLAALGKNKEACATYAELSKALPDAPATIKGKAENERQRLGCR